jgi:hypothetical protein
LVLAESPEVNLDYTLVLTDSGRDLACILSLSPELRDGELFGRIDRFAVKPM